MPMKSLIHEVSIGSCCRATGSIRITIFPSQPRFRLRVDERIEAAHQLRALVSVEVTSRTT